MSRAASFIQHGKKIVAIGRNYADHIAELNNQRPKEPFFFLKPTTSYTTSGTPVEIPRGVDLHHEVELGVVIGSRARDVSQADAMQHVAGYCLAIDYTARNMQNDVKKKGLPWSAVKGFDTFCPVSDFLPASAIKDPYNLRLWYKVNGETRQNESSALMLFQIPRLIEHCSSIMTLEEGDLLLTGTPAGVSRIVAGDKVEAGLEQDGELIASIKHDTVDRQGGYSFTSGA